MSNKNKNNKPDAAPATPATNTLDLAKLFEHAESIDALCTTKENELKALQATRSEAVKAIFEASGNKHGPYNRKGKLISIVSRNLKGDASPLYFFRASTRSTINV